MPSVRSDGQPATVSHSGGGDRPGGRRPRRHGVQTQTLDSHSGRHSHSAESVRSPTLIADYLMYDDTH